MSPRSNIEMESPGMNVVAIKKDADGWKFLLLKRAKGETYEGFWGFVSGGREGDETVPQLAARELKEETGLIAESLWATEYVFQFYEPTVDKIWILPVIAAIVKPDTQVKLSEENSEFRWLTAEEVIELIQWKNIRQVVAELAEELGRFPADNWVEIIP